MFKKIYIEITNYCNLKCEFCKTNVRDKKFLTLEEFEIIINKVKKYTNFIYLHVLGEPLTHKNIRDFILICKENDIKVNITTNGTLINRVPEDLIDSIHQINISLHCDYKNIMSEEQYYNKIFSFIKNNSKNVYINLRLWNENSNLISDDNQYIIRKISDELQINLDIQESYRRNKAITLKQNLFLHLDEKFIWPKEGNDEIFLKGSCYGLKDHIGILSSGDVVPCCLDGDGSMVLGNIFIHDLDYILNSKRALSIKNNFKNKKVIESYCKTCGFAVRNNKL